MNRRVFLSKFGNTAAAAGAGAAAMAAATVPKVRGGVDAGLARLGGNIKALHARLDDMDESHRRLLRMLLVAVSLSTGFDALTLFKGDLL